MNSKKKVKHSALKIGAVLALSASLLTACSNGGTQATNATKSSGEGKLKVVAAENFYGEVLQAVGGERVEVVSLLTSPEQDPHEYEATPADSKSVADANYVVYNGIGYDEWMEKLLGASTSTKTKVAVGSDVMGKRLGDNPHIWYDPSTISKLTERVAQDLGTLDPSHASEYKQRAEEYLNTLKPLVEKVEKLKQTTPVLIDVSEPVFQYMADALNLKVNNEKFSEAIEDESDPAPAVLADVQDDLKQKRVKLFVHNIQVDSPTVQNIAKLAESSGVPVVRVTETEPKGKNYPEWMNDQLDQIMKGLEVTP
ncbi:metal ABC transporter solute-binding protein, Zn/Mn family [Tumebacillus flagellatus]|uniref:Metal ABC transporter substrate-binding protein n=1 Tax=Tumebacillus flagellatus TaxID=1157490 RepID=A0A074LRP6_9BACL|nr:zinc ABC transporter substrate-binding protein [Tumebacillus flagellatus]KEO84816.1 hypothetical protein EL26_02050 [Tumebacillus flagellatus]